MQISVWNFDQDLLVALEVFADFGNPEKLQFWGHEMGFALEIRSNLMQEEPKSSFEFGDNFHHKFCP